MEDNELMKEILLDVHRGIGILGNDVAAIKVDLREHMKRTAMLETEMKWIHKQIWIAHGAIIVVTMLGSLIGFFLKYKII